MDDGWMMGGWVHGWKEPHCTRFQRTIDDNKSGSSVTSKTPGCSQGRSCAFILLILPPSVHCFPVPTVKPGLGRQQERGRIGPTWGGWVVQVQRPGPLPQGPLRSPRGWAARHSAESAARWGARGFGVFLEKSWCSNARPAGLRVQSGSHRARGRGEYGEVKKYKIKTFSYLNRKDFKRIHAAVSTVVSHFFILVNIREENHEMVSFLCD